MMARSITCPFPPRASRRYSANIAATAPARPAMPSASPKGGSVGGPSGCPVMCAKPLIDSARVPKPGRDEYGPYCPNPVVRTTTSRSFSARRRSGPMFQRSSVPGRKFSMTTSASRASARNSSCPSAVERLRVTVRLFRPTTFHQSGTPSFECPCVRIGSPFGCSILITSAPKSPRNVAMSGPAKSVATSRTRTPSSGRDCAAVTAAPRQARAGTSRPDA